MKYPISQESQQPDSSSLQMLDEVIDRLLSSHPDREDLSDWAKNYIWGRVQRLRVAFDLDYVNKYISKNDSILEVGSIPLMLTCALDKQGYKVQGLDLAPGRFQTIIEDMTLNVSECDIEKEKLPFPDNEFRAVIFNELFEHLRINLIFTLREIHRVLRPDGILMLSTPNFLSLSGIINFLFRGRSYSCGADIYDEYLKLETLGHMGHVREYTPYEVCCFLEKIGFTIKELIYRGQYQSSWQRLAIKMFPKLRPFVSVVATK